MAFTGSRIPELQQADGGRRLRPAPVLAAALVFAAGAWLWEMPLARMSLALVAATLGFAALWLTIQAVGDRAGARNRVRVVADLIGDDSSCSLLAGADGHILYANTAAVRAFGADHAGTVAGTLRSVLANPGALLYRMESRAGVTGSAQEDVVTRDGHLRLSVHRAGAGQFLWRVARSADQPRSAGDGGAALPMLTLGRKDAILYMNAAARDLIGERARSLSRICPTLPLRSGQLNDIATRDGLAACFVVELEGTAGRREVFVLPGVAATERQPDGWAFFDELPVPLLKLARSGAVQLSNRPARALLGVDTCQGQALGDLMEGLGRSISDWLEDAAAGRGTVHSEFLRVRHAEQEVFVQVTLNRAAENGETVLIAVLSDATQLKSLEAQFVQSQKMQAIGQLAGGVAHDFNNLLTAISGHCDLLLLRHDQGDPDYGDLMQIHQNANRAGALVNQLLAYSRKQTLRPELIDLRDALADLIHLLNRLVGEKVTLSLSHDPGLLSIRADKRQLEQVLMNLVVNARDAMPGGGDIRIVTENLDLSAPMRRDRAVVAPGRYVSVKVIDQGVGIPRDKLQKVFEPFFTTKRTGEGTGLGLSTAYGIIKQTGGFIFADSTADEGTCFTLLLPAHERPPAAAKDAGRADAAPRRGDGVVVLVEDEAPVRAFAARALQMRGFTVLEADSAEAALDLLSDPELTVDVFVTDVIMPGMDGPSWVQTALGDRPEVRVVFMSGYAEESFGDIQAKLPHSVFLPKPFSLSELTDTVQRQTG